MLERLRTLTWIQLAPADLEIGSFPSSLQAALRPFSRLGVFDTVLRARPAVALWDSLFGLTRR